MFRRITVIILLSLVLLPSVTGVASFTEKSYRKTRGREAVFRIGVLNFDNYTKEVRIGINGGNDVLVEQEGQKMLLEPSEVTENPDGGGWQALEDGLYARPEFLELEVKVNRSSYRGNHSFRLVLTTVPEEEIEGILSQKVVEQTEHRLTIRSLSPVLSEKKDGEDFSSLWSSEEGEGEDEGEKEEKGQKDVSSPAEEGETEDRDFSKDNYTRKDKQEVEDESETGRSTYILVAGIVLCTALIIREIL